MNELRTLKIGSCQSLSGRSELGFSISCGIDKTLWLTITSNTGKGLFMKAPILFSQILPIDDMPFSSGIYQAMFKGGSVNTAGFVLAILKHLGLVQNVADSSRKYIRCDTSSFNAEMHALMDAAPPTSPSIKTKKVKLAKNEGAS